MPTLHQSLLALQAADGEIEQCRRHIHALQAELSDEREVTASRNALEAARRELAEAEAAVRTGEMALDELVRTIARLEKRLFDGSIHNAREATSTEEELAHRRQEHGPAEEAVLAAMERVEAGRPAVAAAESRLAAAERTRAERVPAIKAEGREATARLRALQERRAALAAAAPRALLSRYESLKASAPPAVVAIHAGACGSCGVELPSAIRQRVAADELVQCINCNRLLVEG